MKLKESPDQVQIDRELEWKDMSLMFGVEIAHEYMENNYGIYWRGPKGAVTAPFGDSDGRYSKR